MATLAAGVTAARDVRPMRRLRRGQSLVEFAVVALVMYLLLAATLTFGHALYVAQGLQSAADLGAREISRTPLPPMMNFDDPANLADEDSGGAIHHSRVRRRVFDDAMLVIDLDAFYAQFPSDNPNIFVDLVPTLPLLNQQLVTMMIVDRPDTNNDGQPDRWLLRYPGALLERGDSRTPPPGVVASATNPYASTTTYKPWIASSFNVGIPLVNGTWAAVVEEIDTEATPTQNSGDNPDPFNVSSDQQGVVALRINYPFQSASMSSFQRTPGNPFAPNISTPIQANGANDIPVGAPPASLGAPIPQKLVLDAPATSPQNGPIYAGPNGGTYGLGVQGALGGQVRPYRRVISAQAIYRREVFD